MVILIHAVIIVDDGDQLRIITQPDHARLASELLSLWRTHGLPEHPRRDSLLFAVREHDNGWREADAAPWIDPVHHRPFDFLTYPEEARRELWQRGMARFADGDPLVALLIAAHAEAIHQPLGASWQALFETLEAQRQEWLERAGIDQATLQDDYRWLRLADSLSLAFCTRRDDPLAGPIVTAGVEGEFLRLDPFPLAGTTTFQIPARWVPNRPYDSDSQFGGELARARWDRLRMRVAAFE